MEQNVTVIERKKSFDIKAGIALPRKISRYKVDDTCLFIAPEKAAMITVNDMGEKILGLFRNKATIEEVIGILQSQGYTEEKIVAEMNTFLVKLERKGFYEDAEVRIVDIKEPGLHMDLTQRCNLTCVHCLRDAGHGLEHELSTQEWLDVIEKFTSKYKTRVCLSGGEPLLHPGALEIIRKAYESGLKVTLFTNGTLINSLEMAKTLGQYVEKIQMSLDGATPEVNDAIRGLGCFEKVIRAARFLQDTPVIIDISVSVMPQNFDDLRDNFEKMIERMGPKVNLRISPSMKEGRAEDKHVFSKSEGEQKVQELTSDLYSKRLKGIRKDEKNIVLSSCGYGETVAITSNGDIYPCNYYEQDNRYGNVRENNLLEVMERIDHDRVAAGVENIEECKRCDLKSVCFGGCRLNNFFKYHTIFRASCTPEYRKMLISRIVKKEETQDPVNLWVNGKNYHEKHAV